MSISALQSLLLKKNELTFVEFKEKAKKLGVKCDHCSNKECVILNIKLTISDLDQEEPTPGI